MSVLLSHLAREPYPARQHSEYLDYVDQSLEILGAMEECHVACKIGDYMREFVSFLRTDPDVAKTSPSEQNPTANQFAAFSDVNTFLSGYAGDFDMGYSEFNFFDGTLATHGGFEGNYVFDGIEPYDSYNMGVK